MSEILKTQLLQESCKLQGTGRGKLFLSSLERIEELEAQLKERDELLDKARGFLMDSDYNPFFINEQLTINNKAYKG